MKRLRGIALACAALLTALSILGPQNVAGGGREDKIHSSMLIVSHHGAALPAWRDAQQSGLCQKNAALVHVDKHSDMEPPWVVLDGDKLWGQTMEDTIYDAIQQPRGSNASLRFFTHGCSRHCRKSCTCLLRNNNFITTAAMDGMISKVLWLYPDFPCSQCGYHKSTRHECDLISGTHVHVFVV